MANLPVPEVLFLRPTNAATKNIVSLPRSNGVGSAGTTPTTPARSVREIMGELRRLGSTHNEPEVCQILKPSPEGSVAIDTFAAEPPRPHFRNAPANQPGRAANHNGSTADPSTADSQVRLVNWPKVVTSLVAQNGSQWDAIHAHLHSQQKIGILGIESGCGATTISAALALSHVERSIGSISGIHGPLNLLDGNLANPGLGSALSLSPSDRWQEWTTSTENDEKHHRDPIVEAQLPGNDQIRIWPLSCGISDATLTAQNPYSDHSRPDSVRYYLPTQALGPITQTLGRVVNRLTTSGHRVFVDLGHMEFWRRLNYVSQVTRMFDRIILVHAAKPDRRCVSKSYWDLRDGGQDSFLLVENPKE
ncbi:MAG: hypothetical protein Q8M16_19810 [Pirellulaceae bacterium]|nr:hypothetical protein [Pirellulaceae bacterium]